MDPPGTAARKNTKVPSVSSSSTSSPPCPPPSSLSAAAAASTTTTTATTTTAAKTKRRTKRPRGSSQETTTRRNDDDNKNSNHDAKNDNEESNSNSNSNNHPTNVDSTKNVPTVTPFSAPLRTTTDANTENEAKEVVIAPSEYDPTRDLVASPPLSPPRSPPSRSPNNNKNQNNNKHENHQETRWYTLSPDVSLEVVVMSSASSASTNETDDNHNPPPQQHQPLFPRITVFDDNPQFVQSLEFVQHHHPKNSNNNNNTTTTTRLVFHHHHRHPTTLDDNEEEGETEQFQQEQEDEHSPSPQTPQPKRRRRRLLLGGSGGAKGNGFLERWRLPTNNHQAQPPPTNPTDTNTTTAACFSDALGTLPPPIVGSSSRPEPQSPNAAAMKMRMTPEPAPQQQLEGADTTGGTIGIEEQEEQVVEVEDHESASSSEEDDNTDTDNNHLDPEHHTNEMVQPKNPYNTTFPPYTPPPTATITNTTNTSRPFALRHKVGVYRNVWNMAAAKHHPPAAANNNNTLPRRTIPHAIVSKRQLLRQRELSSVSSSASVSASSQTNVSRHPTTTKTTTPLHVLCAQPRVTLEEFMTCWRRHPKALTTRDAQGRYPLHILADNETLITASLFSSSTVNAQSSSSSSLQPEQEQQQQQRNVAMVVCGHFMTEFPWALITPDHDGYVPFARLLDDWIEWAHTSTTSTNPISNTNTNTATADIPHDDENNDEEVTVSSSSPPPKQQQQQQQRPPSSSSLAASPSTSHPDDHRQDPHELYPPVPSKKTTKTKTKKKKSGTHSSAPLDFRNSSLVREKQEYYSTRKGLFSGSGGTTTTTAASAVPNRSNHGHSQSHHSSQNTRTLFSHRDGRGGGSSGGKRANNKRGVSDTTNNTTTATPPNRSFQSYFHPTTPTRTTTTAEPHSNTTANTNKNQSQKHGFSSSASSHYDYYWHLAAKSLPKRKKAMMFPRVEVWEEVEWCFAMLSSGLDILFSTPSSWNHQHHHVHHHHDSDEPWTANTQPRTKKRTRTAKKQQQQQETTRNTAPTTATSTPNQQQNHHPSGQDQQPPPTATLDGVSGSIDPEGTKQHIQNRSNAPRRPSAYQPPNDPYHQQQEQPNKEPDEIEEEIHPHQRLVQLLAQKLGQYLICTIFLVDDDAMNTRERVLEQLIIKRLLFCPETVGMWLIDMLNHGGVPAKRAVDYLWLISHLAAGPNKNKRSLSLPPPNQDLEYIHTHEKQVIFDAVGNLKGTIASLVTLDVKETERAASTAIIWHTMSQKLSRPFVLGLVLIDLLLHLILMVAFRPIANPQAELSRLDVKPATVVFFISVHYLLRKACEAWVLFTVSPVAIRAYFGNMWTIFDSFATILTLWATIWHNRISDDGEYQHNGLNSLVVGVLWIKVLGFLKVVNKEMSTFILALSQILYDIRLFMIVLVVCVIMFADMFFIAVSTKDNGQYCKNLDIDEDHDSGTMKDFCTSAFSSYLRVYSILLGDFEMDDLTETPGTEILFIIFTVFGVIILLNVLIAIISDSYEKATMSGNLLFGRARILYVAQNEALERFLQPRQQPTAGSSSSSSDFFLGKSSRYKKARRLLRWTVLLAILASATYALLFMIGLLGTFARYESWFSFFIGLCMVFLLSCALWVVATYVLDGILRNLLPDRAERLYDAIGHINNWFVARISNLLFGLNKEKILTLGSNGASEEDWHGRVKYLENVIERMVNETKLELKSEMMEMRAEVQSIHEYITTDHQTIQQ